MKNPLHEFGQTLSPGTGLTFRLNDRELWLIRSTARQGRYSICTTFREPTQTIGYTVVDWELGLRGPLNLTGVKEMKRYGQDDQIDRMVARLEDPRRQVYLVHGKSIPLDLAGIDFPLEGAAELFPGTVVEHVGPLPKLTKLDRCDRCGAQSMVAVRLRECGRRLDFCGHHYAGAALDLVLLIDAIEDDRESLVSR